jgi:peptidoglycan hydrolase-like protein with peptidoglycan-binding domain
LTHTLQQTGGVARVQRQENVNTGSPSTGNGSSPGSGRRMISYGSQGKDVVDAQQLLNQHGAAPPLVIDGIFGPKTRQATIEFQKTHGLVPDGIIGPLTWGALESGAPGTATAGTTTAGTATDASRTLDKRRSGDDRRAHPARRADGIPEHRGSNRR